MLPPFHGDRMRAHRDLIAGLAAAEVERWPRGEPFATHPRMQALTLDVIMRVVFGAELPALRGAIRRTLDMTMSLPRMLFFSLTGNDLGFRRAIDEVERELTAVIRARRAAHARPPPILDELIAAGSADDELRDQLVTLLAAGHETTAGSLAWALERLARHPDVLARLRDDEPGYADAVVKEVLRTRPVLTVAARKLVAPLAVARLGAARRRARRALHLPHASPARPLPEPTAFRPERFLGDARARQLRVDPVRRRRPPLRRRRVRGDGDERGAARGRRARDAARPAARGRAHAPPLGHADARAPGARDRRAATFRRRVPLFCRHNRLTQNCPICSRELAAEPRRRPGAPARTSRARPPARRRPAAPRRRHAERAARRRRRLPQPARPGPARDRRRRAPRRRARVGRRPARAARPASRGRRGAGPRGGVLARVPARARPPGRASCTRRSSRRGRAGRAASCPTSRRRPADGPRLPRLGGARRLAGRRRSSASPAGRPSGASGAPSSASRCPGCGRGARYELLVTLGAAGRSPSRRRRPAHRQGRRRDHARRQAPARLGRRDAARAPRRRPRGGCRRPPRRARPRARGVGRGRGARATEAPPRLRAALGLP